MESDSLFGDLFPHHAEMNELVVAPKNFDCLRFLMSTHDSFCGSFDDYSLKFVKHFVHTCETESSETVAAYAEKMMKNCQKSIEIIQ